MSIVVEQPGLFTTVQDCGRWGYQRYGVPVAGAMDMPSHRLANTLVGNSPGAASLEITLMGPELLFEAATTFAVTGADFDVRLDATAVESNTTWVGDSGQRLAFGARRRGVRAYLSVAGGFETDLVFGSRATHVPSRMGGIGGRPLERGDRLDVGKSRQTMRAGTHRSAITALPGDGARVRVIMTASTDPPQIEQQQRLERSRFWVAAESNRMGYRLEGSRLTTAEGSSTISSAVTLGAVQVPPDGLPIVLMADHQTSGGYPHVATVISADIAILGQLMASNWIEFEVCTQEDALRALVAQERVLVA